MGNAVIVNTTAVELGLGTGGWHVLHWNLARDSFRIGGGREIKARYLSTQLNVEAADGNTSNLAGMPVVVAGLHSQVAAVAVAVKNARPVVAMGPGGMGTDSPLGFSAIEVGPVLDAAARMGGVPIATLRASVLDERARHRGLSHHSTTALTLATSARALIGAPSGVDVPSEIRARHQVVDVAPTGIVDAMKDHGLAIESMGRPAADDPLLFECAAAAGVLASRELP